MTAKTIEKYLDQLEEALSGSDRALIQDALSDAEEHLRTALENMQAAQPDTPETEAIQSIIEEYGSPEEIAEAYREVETYTRPALATPKTDQRSGLARFFGVFAEPQAWGALVYMLISLLTGTIYFSWAVTGVLTSLVFALFIFGLPLAALFVLSIRGVALVEGRIVEALLGIRMPRRPIFSPPNLGWRQRLWAQLLELQTWKILVYLILQMPLGLAYFSVFVLLIATAITLAALPIFSSLGMPVLMINGTNYYPPVETFPFTVAFGVLLATLAMHLAKALGNLHGRFAKWMLMSH